MTFAVSQPSPALSRSRLVPPSVTTTPAAPTTQNRAASRTRSRYRPAAVLAMGSTLGRRPGPARRPAGRLYEFIPEAGPSYAGQPAAPAPPAARAPAAS